MKTNYSALDSLILEVLAKVDKSLDAMLVIGAVRDAAIRVAPQRAGVPPSGSADLTVNERLQSLRREGQISYDRATARWTCTGA
jgi:hypothetical protein